MKMNLKCTLILFFLFFFSFDFFSQTNPPYPHSYPHCISLDMDINLLKKNKVARIIKFSVNKTSGKKDTLEIYYFNNSYELYKKVYKNISSQKFQWMAAEFNSNAAKSMTIYKEGEFNGDSISKVYERQTTYFNKLKQRVKIIEEDFIAKPNTISIYEPKPVNAENDYKRIIFHLNNFDTISIMSYNRTPKLYTYVMHEKSDGKWTVRENDSTTYANGKLNTYKSYINGKLVNSDTFKGILNKEMLDKEIPGNGGKNIDTDQFMLNGHYMEKISIGFASDISKRNYQEIKNIKRSKKDFKVVKHYDNSSNAKEKINWVEIFYPNDLIHSRDLINEKSYTFFEYQ